MGLIALWILVVLIGLVGCGGNRPELVQVSEAELAALRLEVRSMLRPGCGSCHTTGLPTAKPAAIAVFDFREDSWSAPMTPEELEGLVSRSRDFAETPRSKVDLLVGAELARRGTGG